jgi:hypothetical protein
MSTPSTASTPDIMNPDDHPLAAATVTRFINHGTPGMTGQSSGCKRSWRKRRESWIPLARRFGSSPRDVGLGVSPVVSNKCVANNPKCWFHFRIFQGPRNLNMFFFSKECKPWIFHQPLLVGLSRYNNRQACCRRALGYLAKTLQWTLEERLRGCVKMSLYLYRLR